MTERRDSSAWGMLRGIGLLLRGRRQGFSRFGNNGAAFLFSLAPLLSMPLFGAGISMGQAGPRGVAVNLLATVCTLLLPPVVSQALAERWSRAALWPRYATAFNWCQWALSLLLAIGLLAGAGAAAGLRGAIPAPRGEILRGFVAVFGLYSLWLQWFLARRGLMLSRWQATGMVAAVTLAVGLFMAAALALRAGLG